MIDTFGTLLDAAVEYLHSPVSSVQVICSAGQRPL